MFIDNFLDKDELELKIESSDYCEIFGPPFKIQNYHNYHVLPPPKIVIVIVDSGIVGAVKHQIGR